ncbi:MAG: PAS domain S-box protein, partial [bacterium]
MKRKKPTYEELEARLAKTEETLQAIRAGEIDVIIGEKCPFIIKAKEVEEELREARERLELAISGSNGGFWDLKFDPSDPWQIPDEIYISPRLKEFIGFQDQEFPNSISAWHSRIHPDDLELVRKTAQEHLEGLRDIHEVEYRIYHKDGSIRWIHSRGKIFCDEKGVPKRWTGIDWDITEKKKIEESLKVAEEKFSKIFQYSPNLIAIADPEDGRLIDVNGTWVQATGFSKEEALGKTTIELGLWVNLADRERCIREFKNKGKVRGFEARFLHKGEERIYMASGEPIEIGGKKLVLWEFADITELKRLQEKEREAEEKYRVVVENAGEAIVVTQDGVIKFVNQKATEIIGYAYEEFLEHSILEFIYPEDRDKVLDYRNQRLNGEKDVPNVYTYRVVDKWGNIKWVEINVVLINWQGKPATLAFLRDITELKKSEEERVVLQEQLQQAQKMEAIGRLAGGVAHDFNNLLTVIKAYSQLALLQLREGDPLKGALEEVDKAADKAANLTRQLLAFSRRQVMEFKV